MTCRSFLMLAFLLFLVPHAGAVDTEEWRAFERAYDNDRVDVIKNTELELQQAQQRGDKRGQLKAIRKLAHGIATYGRAPYQRVHALGVALAGELRDDESLGWFFFTEAGLELKDGNRAEAAASLQQATTIAMRNGFASLHAYILLYDLGPLYESEKVARVTKAYTLFESVHDTRGMALTLGWMGMIYQFDDDLRNGEDGWKEARQEAMRKVIEYETRALALIVPEINLALAGPAHLRLGVAYTRLDDFRRAKEHLEKAISIGENYENRRWIAHPEFHLANVLKLEKRYEEALVHVETALRLLVAPGSSQELNMVYLRAQILAQLGRKQESLEGLSKAEALLPSAKKLRSYRDYYFQTANTYALLGDYQQAYRKMTRLSEYERGNAKLNDRKVADEFKIRFDMQLKEAENALLRSRQQQADARRIALMLSLALSPLFLGAVWFQLRRRTAAARVEAAHHRALAAAEVAANEAKRTFLANMSHELRSPLNVVLGFTQLLMNRTELPHDARQDLTAIYNSGQYLYTLINQVLDLSKIETGNLTLNETDFDLYALMDELADMFILPAKQKGLHLLIENDPDVPQYLHADALKLRQVLINLLNNAIKFTSEGSIALNVDLASGPDSGISFAVSDTGPGVAPDELDKLGNAFVQAQAGRVAQEGTGLGLAISANFLQLMGGGPLKFSSRLGEGMTITFDLPAKISQSATAPAIGAQLRVVGLAPGQPSYRILVTDDRAESRKLLARLLTPLGFEVREAGNGETALAVWDEWSPHLIWMDMRMPVMDGREATRRIRATEKGKATVIIALTASSVGDQRRQILAYGCNDFLRKPFREWELFDMMQKNLGVQFVYEGNPDATDRHAAPDAVSLANFPAALREPLGQALKELDVDAVEALIAQVRAHDSTLARTLEKMAYRYEYEYMRELVAGDATVQ